MDKPRQTVAYYLGHVAAYERDFKKWESRVEKIIKRYRDEKREGTGAKFNVLWSNVQTLKAATFSRMPMPDVSRRFKDQDAVGRVASLMLERALEFEVQHYKDYGASIRQCVYDRFLGGRGTAWVRYEPTFKQVKAGETPEDGPLVTEDVETETDIAEELDFECAPVDYVHWRDFGHAIARTWEEVPIVWRKVYMRRPALRERFAEAGDKIPLDASPTELSKSKGSEDSTAKFALIYEIWDKDTGQAVWISKSMNEFVDCREDPLGLEEFFPCPPPLFSTLTTDDLIPLPDFTIYQDQAAELDTLSERIRGLIDALQVRGVHDASVPELARLFTEAGNGQLIPVKNWQALAEKMGLKGAIDIVDLLPFAQALKEAYLAFEQIKNQIYELTGISDIIRGQTAASETATAQQIKNNYASMRLKVYQDEVERFATRLLQLKAQIICKHFDAETICKISACDQLSDADKQLVPQALQMLKDDVMRAFRIEVQTDSMVYQDEGQEKADRMEFLNATSQFIEKIVQASQMAPQLIPLGVEMLKFGVTGFRVGKSLEGTIDQAAEQMKAQAAQQAANPQPHPDQIKAQADMQKTQMQIQADQQADRAKAQADIAIAQAQAQADQQIEAQRQQHEQQMAQMDAQRAAMEAHMSQQTEAMKAHMAQQSEQMQQQMALLIAQLNNANKLEVAEISAQTTLDAAQISAAKQASAE